MDESTAKHASKYINEIYDNLSYYDIYGTTVIQFILLTLFVFYIYIYSNVIQNKEEIINDWTNQRCNPKYIPFAGFITHPEGITAFDYTAENFNYCIQNIQNTVVGQSLEPFNYLINNVTEMLSSIGNSTQKTRELINLIRQRIKIFVEDIMYRILNVTIPLQTMMITLLDTFNKIQGIMTGGLYTMLGSYLTLQSLMGAIVELTIKMLVVLVAIIVGLWVTPFTWPVAASTTAVFLSISIPLSMIVIVLSKVLQINSSNIPKLRCFDPNTLLEMNDGTYKKIINIKAGDILANNVIVTAKIKVDSADLRMYLLNNIIISESHIVKYLDQWIAIRDHPLAKELPKNMYSEPYLYCLNTSSKEIIIDNMIFTDWDEIYDDTLLKVIDAIPQNLFINDISLKKENIHKYLDEGFEKDTRVYLIDGTKKHIKDVSIGDKLSTKGIVYGIVEIKIEKGKEAILGNIEENGNNNVLYHLLISNKLFETDRKIIRDYNDKIDFICHKKII
jgi:hypothetical protein